MPVSPAFKSAPEAVQEIVTDFLRGLMAIPAPFIEGIYLTGSAALGDYHPAKSDIDLLVVCRELPEKALQDRIRSIHRSIESRCRRPLLNGYYITADGLDGLKATSAPALWFHEGCLKKTVFDMAPVTLHELRTTAITVYGTPVAQLPVRITQQEVARFMLRNINTYWVSWINAAALFNGRLLLLLLFPVVTEWVILGIARQWYTLHTGQIISKTGAGQYALEQVPSRYHKVIRQAMGIRRESPGGIRMNALCHLQPSLHRARDTMACARWIIRQFNRDYRSIHATTMQQD